MVLDFSLLIVFYNGEVKNQHFFPVTTNLPNCSQGGT